MKSWLLLLAFIGSFAPAAFSQAVLRRGDVFELRLSGMPAEFANEFTLQYTVGDDNLVKIPYVGDVQAGGLSVTDFARAVEKKLVAGEIFTNPTAVVNLQPQSRFVTVGGEVRAAQAIPWSSDLTVTQAVKRVGGPNEWGKLSKIKITRDGKSWMLNATKADKDPNQNPKLLPGDEIEVQ